MRCHRPRRHIRVLSPACACAPGSSNRCASQPKIPGYDIQLQPQFRPRFGRSHRRHDTRGGARREHIARRRFVRSETVWVMFCDSISFFAFLLELL
ncbi:hypothetical protein B0H19DRAFT_1169713 [Mycena capillaripes]|nr:hypothetical protein B0H19DRAFT_1169713 [Mycena capillaripes]